MRKRNFLVTTARTAMAVLTVTAGTMLTACTDNEIYTDGPTAAQKATAPDNAIAFGTYMGKAATRAEVSKAYTSGSIGNADNTTQGVTDLKKARFGVFSYFTGTTDYVTATPTNLIPNFMYNQELWYDDNTSSGKDAWVYAPVKYWPNGTDAANSDNTPSNTAGEKQVGKLSFFAFAPFTTTPSTAYAQGTDGEKPSAIGTGTNNDDKVKKNDVTNGVKALTTNNWNGNVWVKYLMPTATESDAVDLLWGVRGSSSYSETDNTASTGTVGTDYNINLTKQTVDEKVSFLFKHALAKIGGSVSETESTTGTPDVSCGFMVKVDVDGNNNSKQTDYFPTNFTANKTLVTIKSVKIQDGYSAWTDRANNGIASDASAIASNLIQSGWFNIETGTWCKEVNTFTTGGTYSLEANSDNDDVNDATYTLNEAFKEAATYGQNGSGKAKVMKTGNEEWDDNYPTGVTVAAQPLFCNENVPGLMIIPIEGQSSDLYVTIDYVVRTADKNLNTGFTEVEQVITNKVNLASLAPNKYYKIIMHLGLTSVKFEAVVSDWQKKSDSSLDENGKETGGSDENKGSVWLPSNVVNFSRSANVNYNVTNYAFDGSALGLGDVVSGTTSGNITKVEKDGTTSTTANITLTANSSTATVSSTTTITYELGTVTLTITQDPTPSPSRRR
jgi:hypothetical protein